MYDLLWNTNTLKLTYIYLYISGNINLYRIFKTFIIIFFIFWPENEITSMSEVFSLCYHCTLQKEIVDSILHHGQYIIYMILDLKY